MVSVLFPYQETQSKMTTDISNKPLNLERQNNTIVFGIRRGGVVTADTVVRRLSSSANAAVDFDIIIPRKLTDPDNKEQAIGAVMEDGTSAQLALTGHEGLIGTSLFMGGGTTSNRGLVQCAGYAYRLPAGILRRELPLSLHVCWRRRWSAVSRQYSPWRPKRNLYLLH